MWAALLAFSLYALLGPWMLYDALSGYPPAALFHFGVLGRLPLGTAAGVAEGTAGATGWRFIATCDTMFVTLVHCIVCLLPATLWVACVVARRCQLQPHAYAAVSRSASSDSSGSEGRRRRMETGGGAGSATSLQGGCAAAGPDGCVRWSFSAAQVAAFVGLALFNVSAMYRKAGALMGGIALAVSPGFAWTLPLALLLVVGCGGPRRPCGRTAKGE